MYSLTIRATRVQQMAKYLSVVIVVIIVCVDVVPVLGISELWDVIRAETTGADESDYTPDSSDTSSPLINNKLFLDEKQALDMFGGHRERDGAVANNRFGRSRRGIVDECCRKPCTIKELYSYCE
ncbi:unnamed protein product [Oppiella nova]|uniref:Insulin-like domain-containing protein n=1 Tax=Oppiella nova TaxID=334625 RepID=A0A7R9QQR5_9ACAR|nr:unnamed protein product [Oppiella nova]CAG2172140.1 unnamed protein product [Oppiella nova]